MARYYAGVGSRETPVAVQLFMTELAQGLALRDFTLRSGGAPGADTAFELGAGDNKEIFLPWEGFNGNPSPLWRQARALDIQREAAAYHPTWGTLNEGGRRLHARNLCQILGAGRNRPVEFVVCWTRLGLGRGGTGQALRIARAHSIPIYDLGAFSAEYVRRKIFQEHAYE